jgi:hypothetical protein
MDYNIILKVLEDTREEYHREMRRGVLQRDMMKAHDALVGMESIERLERRLKMEHRDQAERRSEEERDLRKAFRPRKDAPSDRPYRKSA